MTNLLPCIEWADSLALKPTDLPPERREALHAHLATCPGCAATYADYQMLIGRLRTLPRPALPTLAPLTPDLIVAPEDQERAENAYDSIRMQAADSPDRENALPPLRLPPARHRRWPQFLSTMAAALLLTALVGSLVVVLHRSEQAGGTPEQDFRLRAGWSVLVEYSGTGSQTITGQQIAMPRLWGKAYGCVGSGSLDIQITGPSAAMSYDMSADRCGIPARPIVSPQTFTFDNAPVGTLDTIKVTANVSTRWFFQFTEAVDQPSLTLGPEWANVTSLAGTGNFRTTWLDDTQPPAYQTLGVVVTCLGSGTGTIHFTPDAGTITMPACTGEPSMVKVTYGAATRLQAAEVDVPTTMLWNLALFGCTDEQRCAGD